MVNCLQVRKLHLRDWESWSEGKRGEEKRYGMNVSYLETVYGDGGRENFEGNEIKSLKCLKYYTVLKVGNY